MQRLASSVRAASTRSRSQALSFSPTGFVMLVGHEAESDLTTPPPHI